jgi:hypothetical protein
MADSLKMPNPKDIELNGSGLWAYAGFIWSVFRDVYGDIPAATPEDVRAAAERATSMVEDTKRFVGYGQREIAACSHHLANLLGPGIDFPNTAEGRTVWAKLLTIVEAMEAKRLDVSLFKAA